jgi:hypothetical protein
MNSARGFRLHVAHEPSRRGKRSLLFGIARDVTANMYNEEYASSASHAHYATPPPNLTVRRQANYARKHYFIADAAIMSRAI